MRVAGLFVAFVALVGLASTAATALLVRLALASLRAQGAWEWLRLVLFNPTAGVLLVSVALAWLVARAHGRAGGTERARRRAGPVAAALPPLVAVAILLRPGLFTPLTLYRIHPEWKVIGYTPGCPDRCQGGACVRVCINADGFRDGPFPGSAPRRALMVGDSYVMGTGVPDAGRLDVQLERALAEASAERWDVLNAGVEGLNFHSYVRMVEALAPRLAPEVVVVGFLGNGDLVPEDPWERLESYQSALFALSALALVERDLYALEHERHHAWLHGYQPPHWARSYDARPPPAFAKLFERDLARLLDLRRAHGFGLVVLSYFGPDARFRAAESAGWLSVVAPDFAWNEDARYAIPGDGHPTAEGNALFARLAAPAVIEAARARSAAR